MSCIYIDKKKYFHNLDLLSKKAGNSDKIMAVLKDNAYGHGLEIMSKLAYEYGIKKIAVKNINEALQIKKDFDEILILADHPPKNTVQSNISFAMHSLAEVENFPKNCSVHLCVDSGMHRNGILEKDLEVAIVKIKEHQLNLRGVFTHFRSSDEISSEFFWQQENYKRIKQNARLFITSHGLKMPNFHSCNSAALLRRTSELDDDFARCGISSYGYNNLYYGFGNFDLRPCLSLWSEKLSTRKIKQGDKIGYGGVFEAKKDMVISTYDIGYGDGFFRHDGKNKLKLDNGQKILGRISMDSLCIAGDKRKVCLFEDATNLAKHFKTINYEIITKLSFNIKREVV